MRKIKQKLMWDDELRGSLLGEITSAEREITKFYGPHYKYDD